MNLRAAPSFFRDLVTAFRPKPWSLEKPTVLQFPVNDICNSGCEMCHIWKHKRDIEISPQQLDGVLSDPLFDRVVNVGLNGGEPTLRRDLPDLVRVACLRLPSLQRFSLITNALVPRRVIPAIEQVAAIARSFDKKLDVMISLDGVGDVHDRVRGRPGNFTRVQEVLQAVKGIHGIESHQFGYTIVRDNVFSLWNTLDFAIHEATYIKFRLGVPHRRLYTQNLTAPFALTEEERYHVCTFLQNLLREYETGAQQRETYRSLIGQLAYDAPRTSGCNWQHRGATLTSRGELAYCAVESRSLGDATQTSSSAMYFGNAPYQKEIFESKCSRCSHDYGGISPGFGYLRQVATELGYQKYQSPLQRTIIGSIGAKTTFLSRVKRLEHLPSRELVRNPARILICGWYGTETLGDKAILAGCVGTLRALNPEYSFDVASLDPFITRQTVRQLPELEDVSVLSFGDALSSISRYGIVAFGGGPLMGVKALADNLSLFRRANALGVFKLVLGCGVGPIGHGFYRRHISELLRLADVRIYRDEESRAAASKLGIDITGDIVTPDPAHIWLARKTPPSTHTLRSNEVVLGLRDWPLEQYGTGTRGDLSTKQRFEHTLMSALAELLRRERETRLVPVPMSTNAAGGDDRWYYRKLFRTAQLPPERIDWSMLEREVALDEVLDRFRSAGRILTMRFHALVFATTMGRPTLAIDYTLGRGKVAALSRRLKVPTLDLSTVTADQIVQALEQLSFQNPYPVPEGTNPLLSALRQLLPRQR